MPFWRPWWWCGVVGDVAGVGQRLVMLEHEGESKVSGLRSELRLELAMVG